MTNTMQSTMVYVATAQARCIEAKTGTLLWSNRTLGAANGPTPDNAAANAVNIFFQDFMNPFPTRG